MTIFVFGMSRHIDFSEERAISIFGAEDTLYTENGSSRFILNLAKAVQIYAPSQHRRQQWTFERFCQPYKNNSNRCATQQSYSLMFLRVL